MESLGTLHVDDLLIKWNTENHNIYRPREHIFPKSFFKRFFVVVYLKEIAKESTSRELSPRTLGSCPEMKANAYLTEPPDREPGTVF